MSTTSTLFRMSCHANPGAAWAGSLSAPVPADGAAGEGQPGWVSPWEGPAEAEIMKGAFWPDVVGVGSYGPPFIVSGRVADALRQLPAPGFSPQPVTIREIQPGRLRGLKPPDYFYLRVRRGVGVALHYGSDAKRRQEEGESTALAHASRITLRPETYGGEAIVGLEGYPRIVFCSLAVLELAHRHRWTNFHFEPIDVLAWHRNAVDWPGIDYSSDLWPPPHWYPPAPSTGRTMSGWLDYIRTEEALSTRELYALLDFGMEAIPPLLRMLDDPALSERGRYNVADVLSRFQNEFCITLPEGKDGKVAEALALGPPGPPGF